MREIKTIGIKVLKDNLSSYLRSVLSILETRRALIRAETEGIIDAGEHQRLKGLFSEHSTSWAYLEINSLIRERTVLPFPMEPVRTQDAIHLSTAPKVSSDLS